MIKFNWREILSRESSLVVLLLLISIAAHGFNMFRYPYYENDEGTYMSQAWSLITQGKMAPYTYWYDHAPAGWILIALWTKLTGGFFTFGMTVNSGRVLMLLLHAASAGFLYYIAHRLTSSRLPGVIAVLIFSLSPLGIYFQRRVLLDNIMIFWTLASFALLLKPHLRLSNIIASAVMFGVAVLSKENAVFFAPAFLYVVYTKSSPHHRELAAVKWIIVSGLVISLYFLYALLKGELFPALTGAKEHVSLIASFREQLGRGSGLPFWHPFSDFYTNLAGWIDRDPYTIMVGAAASAVGLVMGLKNPALRITSFFAVLFWFFLLRGKLVIDFYIVPLMPLLALNIGTVGHYLARRFSFNNTHLYTIWSATLIISSILLTFGYTFKHFLRDETSSQVKAVEWIRQNIDPHEFIAIDSSIYLDLHAAPRKGIPVFPNAQWSWKLEKDKEITQGVLKGDWKNITYIALTHEILKQIRDTKFELLKHALDNSNPVVEWTQDSTSYFNRQQYISTNGDWMAVYKLKNPDQMSIENSWKAYKHNFLKSYGRIINPQDNNSTTSEAQSYALLRSAWIGDKPAFDGVWDWTRDHLQHRTQDKLFSWLWVGEENGGKLADAATAADADQDIALALLFAYKRWSDPKYLMSARQIMDDIWNKEVVSANGKLFLMSGSDAHQGDVIIVNPSYLSPATYRIFAQVDSFHPWDKLAQDSYTLLNQLGPLPPNWVLVDAVTGQTNPAAGRVGDPNANDFGFDAFRIYWRIAQDAEWFNSLSAREYLQSASDFFYSQWTDNQAFSAIYTSDGSPVVRYSTLSTASGPYFLLRKTHPDSAYEIKRTIFEDVFDTSTWTWSGGENYYDQNWAWFAQAFDSGYITNLWSDAAPGKLSSR